MLTDIAIKSLKSKDKPYKVADRDGLYVSVAPTGTKTFRYDYRVNGRRETLTIGRYGKYGITLAAAREQLMPSGGNIPKLFYGTQVGTEPLSLIVFVNDPKLFKDQYRRYLEQRFRVAFDCEEVPIRIVFKKRDKVVLSDRG